ncbi:hypothetical protein K402DRAFT_425536 [Aulographum hederae CBS 113979]|uniref:Uncharacterized protein n=1 Tax=Aulographum hederae CBS 113979 TaxID=1176131 RepID=A0A6G1GJX9_9PEZI|nr:hypothetical protein K402DRAFT_425536 [Aulographum hederae CBS 113979]
MMVPRSYMFQTSQRQPSPDRVQKEKPAMGYATARPRTTSPKRPDIRPVSLLRKTSEPVIVPSKPVSIPTQPATPNNIPPTTPEVHAARSRSQHSVRRRHGVEENHKPDAMPPAVAALLAVTSIPPRNPAGRRKTSTGTFTRVSIDELMQEWRAEDIPTPSLGSSPLDILLETPDETPSSDEVSINEVDEKERPLITSRSLSSTSLSSIPELDPDDRSLSSWSSPSTPSSMSRRYRKEKPKMTLSSPVPEDSVLDHPLLSPLPEYPKDNSDVFSISSSSSSSLSSASNERKPVHPKRKHSTFKSNLTASFQALKSAAKSFSNFTAPSVPPDDLLTRSLLSPPRFASEMRPKPVEGVPTPELRRYLNPSSSRSSQTQIHIQTIPEESSEFSIEQLQEALSLSDTADYASHNPDTPMIQMQTYSRNGKSTQKKKAKGGVDPNSEFGKAVSSVRQREPRENSDFLRVIVLEMNMRREGKLDPKAGGRAKIWLPPRKAGSGGAAAVEGEKGVPRRWRGVSA